MNIRPLLVRRTALLAIVAACSLATPTLLVRPTPSIAGVSTTFTVDSNGDSGDLSPGDAVCDTGSGCTLRAAIEEVNAGAIPG